MKPQKAFNTIKSIFDYVEEQNSMGADFAFDIIMVFSRLHRSVVVEYSPSNDAIAYDRKETMQKLRYIKNDMDAMQHDMTAFFSRIAKKTPVNGATGRVTLAFGHRDDKMVMTMTLHPGAVCGQPGRIPFTRTYGESDFEALRFDLRILDGLFNRHIKPYHVHGLDADGGVVCKNIHARNFADARLRARLMYPDMVCID